MRIISFCLLFLLLAILIVIVIIISENKEKWWRGGWRGGWGGWRGGWRPRGYYREWDYYNYNSCFNNCCDFDKCSQGLGCHWKDSNGKSVSGPPSQCIKHYE